MRWLWIVTAVSCILTGDYAAAKWATGGRLWLWLAFSAWMLGCACYLPVIKAVGLARALTGATVAAAAGAAIIGIAGGEPFGPRQVAGLLLGLAAIALLG